jgi:hypothetical protein
MSAPWFRLDFNDFDIESVLLQDDEVTADISFVQLSGEQLHYIGRLFEDYVRGMVVEWRTLQDILDQ